MKIALVSNSLSNHSGIGKVVNELARYFTEEQHEVHLFAPMGETCPEEYNFHPVPIVRSLWIIGYLSFFLRCGMMLRRETFDIVHIHAPCWFKGGVITCHGLPRIGMQLLKNLDKRYRKEVSRRFILMNILSYPLYDYNYRRGRYRKIIALSKDIRSFLQIFYGIPENDIELIPNGVNLSEYHPDNKKELRSLTRRRHSLSESDFVFLFVGYFFKRKGLAFAIESLKRIKNPHAKLLVVGKDWADQVRFEQYARELGVEKQVVFAGETDETQQYYAASDAFLFPSFYDAYPLVNLEAMASGLPIITSARTGTVDIITDGKNGLIVTDPTNISELSEKMLLLMTDPALRQTLSSEARSTAEKYSWDRIAQRTLSLYETIA